MAIRIILIIAAVNGLVHIDARASENSLPMDKIPIDEIPIEFFKAVSKQEFREIVPYDKCGEKKDDPTVGFSLYKYRTVATSDIAPLSEVFRSLVATYKINFAILKELDYSEDDLQKYARRVETRFSEEQNVIEKS